MALAPAALLLRPVPTSEQHATSSSTASLVNSAGCHSSFCRFLHHARSRPEVNKATIICRITEFKEDAPSQKAEKRSSAIPSGRGTEKRTPLRGLKTDMGPRARRYPKHQPPPPWRKKQDPSEAPDGNNVVEPEGGRLHTFRPAPWKQGALNASIPSSPPSSPHVSGLQEQIPPWQRSDLNVDEKNEQTNAEDDKSAMARIVEKLRTIQKSFDISDGVTSRVTGPLEPNGIASIGLDAGSVATPPGEGSPSSPNFPWERVKDDKAELEQKVVKGAEGRRSREPTLAELSLPREEYIRLRLLGLQQEERLKIGKLGVTQTIVIGIKQLFRKTELVKMRCEGPAAANIKATHLELEKKTGGMVVLRTGKIIVLYRGKDYEVKTVRLAEDDAERKVDGSVSQENQAMALAEVPLPEQLANTGATSSKGDGIGYVHAAVPLDQQLYEKEVEAILEGLGPRYENWGGLLPVPIDADLLPMVIPNYKPPFRLTPYGVRPKLSNEEITNLRRLARPLAPHFVLGRNRGHHGLAAAMVKLWEKSEIAKVAVKQRVQNTNNSIMAEELKRLTGGILLARDKFFITFYRGKDFIPAKVAAALVEREASVRQLQELEEKARDERNIAVRWETVIKPSMAVIARETPNVEPSWVHTMDVKEQNRLKKEVAKVQRITLGHQIDKKLVIAIRKKEKAERELQKLETSLAPIERPADAETITEEERVMFHKVGSKMKAFLLMGRRGVFDGVVENMHLHWKHRELVKVVVKAYNQAEVQETARMLEYESGGVLVSVGPSKKGFAMIMYRGKNYQRPNELRPRNLLNKRKALKRSLEMQRHTSLCQHIKGLEERILTIREELRKLSQADEEDDGVGFMKHIGSSQASPLLETKSDGLPEDEERETARAVGDVQEKGNLQREKEMEQHFFKEKIQVLERLVRSGPKYRADPLTNTERLELRKQALAIQKAPEFFVGKNNGLEGLARGIRIHFLHYPLARVIIKGRSPGTSVEDLVHDLEELTGGVLVSREAKKIILYRGWPKGHSLPFSESLQDLSPELRSALEAEEDWEEDTLDDYMVEGRDDDSEMDDDYVDDAGGLSDVDAALHINDEEDVENTWDEFDEESEKGLSYVEDDEEEEEEEDDYDAVMGLSYTEGEEEDHCESESDSERDSLWNMQLELEDVADEGDDNGDDFDEDFELCGSSNKEAMKVTSAW